MAMNLRHSMNPMAVPAGPGGINLAQRGVTGSTFQSDFTQLGGRNENIFGASKPNILDEERRFIDKVFAIVDKDQSGAIERRELEQMFKLFGVETVYLNTAIERIMANVDDDHDGTISPKEFYNMLSQKFEPGDPASEMLEVFRRMDKKHDNKLDVDELHEVAEMLGEADMDKDEVRLMISNFIELHNKRPPQPSHAQLTGITSPPKGASMEFNGKIVEKDKGNYIIRSEGLKAAEPNSKGEVAMKKDDIRHFKVGDIVTFDRAPGDNVAKNLRDPEIQFDEFYTVMIEEL